jgi:RNase P/RNase MRP subunit p29
MTDFKLGDKVKIAEHSNKEYIGKTGILLSAQTPRLAIKGQDIKWKVCKVKLDNTGEIIDCILHQIIKV